MSAPSHLQAHILNRLEEGMWGVYADPVNTDDSEHLSAFLLFGHDSQCREWPLLVFCSSDDSLRHDIPENATVAAMTEDVDPKPAIWRGAALFLQASDCFMNNFASMYVSNSYDLQSQFAWHLSVIMTRCCSEVLRVHVVGLRLVMQSMYDC